MQAVSNVLCTAIERKQAEKRLEEVREAERNRLARDLHDGALQDLTYSLAEAQFLQAISKEPERDNRLERVIEALKRAGQELHGAIYDLRLEGEREQTLVEMLESLVELHRQRLPDSETELSIEEGFLPPLASRDEVELLRIVQEALTNTRRHAQAHHVRVAVGASGDKFWAEVSDDGDGFDTSEVPAGIGTKELHTTNPHTATLVLSASLERADIARALEAGAAGVLHKSIGIEEVVEAVWRLRAGESLLPSEDVVELLRFACSLREQEYEARQAIAQLSLREKEVLEVLAEGLERQEIAERLNISIHTEHNHMTSILIKLGVHSRLQALAFALHHGIVKLE